MRRGIGIYGGISGAGEPAMGLEAMRHHGGVLQGPVGIFWNLPLVVWRGFWGDGGGRALPLPLPPRWVGEFGEIPLPVATHVPGSPENLPDKYWGYPCPASQDG